MRCILLIPVFLVGCVSTPKPVALPSGESGYAVSCNGTRSDISDCMNKAAEICGGTYEVVNQDSSTTGAVHVGNGVYGAAIKRKLVFYCTGA